MQRFVFTVSNMADKQNLKTLLLGKTQNDVIREVEAHPLKKQKLIAEEFSEVVKCHNVCKFSFFFFFFFFLLKTPPGGSPGLSKVPLF